MLLERFYDPKLAQASYLIGCQATGQGLVVDANRDSDRYLAAAAAGGVRVTHVTETHIHADFVSGSRQLARSTGAELLLSGHGGNDWQYRYADEDGARLVGDGDALEVGNVRVRVLHTPGHTPEHLSFLVTDGATSQEPIAVLTGDFVFVGDVGRPDLLETAAGYEGTMREGARALYASLQRFRALPGHLQVLPGHGAGSACGKALGAVPTSTVGYELLVNWAFRCSDEDDFVRRVLEDQPEPPAYFARMKRLNRDGPADLGGGFPDPPREEAAALDGAADGVILDVRDRSRFAAGHVPGSLNVPLGNDFPGRCGWVVPYDRPVHLVADGVEGAREAARDLALIGVDTVAGYIDVEIAEAWAECNGGLQSYAAIAWPEAEAARAEGAALVDVRGLSEWKEGHVDGAVHVHMGHLRGRADELPKDRPVLLYCRTGSRSAVGASVLQALGFADVRNVEGGVVDRVARGLPLEPA